jgi:uncharacterized protein YbjQ (UPF0145 family)
MTFDNFINFVLPVILLIIGYLVGSYREKQHYASIRKREAEYLYLPTIALKKPFKPDDVVKSQLVNGHVVISIDYFKQFLAALVNFFGGNVTAYETLIDRARREAILRMKEEGKHASEIINVRIETTSISKNDQGGIGAVEVMAYGTAIYR